MNYSIKTKLTAFLMSGAMFFGQALPAFAAEAATASYDDLCGTAAISDTNKTYCAQADIARTTEKFQKMKEIMMMAAGATLTALGVLPFGQAACTPIAVSTDVAGLGIDVAQGLKEKSISSSMMTGLSSAGSLAIQLGAKGLMTSATNAVWLHTPDSISKAKAACLVSAALAFVQGAFSMVAVSSAKKAEQSALSSVSSVDAARTSNGFVVGTGTSTTGSTGSSSGNAQAAVAASCSTQTGDAYLQCAAKVDPEVAALTADPNMVGAIQQSLGGKNLGDFAQAYQGNGSSADAAKYVGDAMGLSSTGTDALKKAIDESAKIAGVDGAYSAAKYVSNNGSAKTGESGDVDFNKLMGGVLGKLNPDADKKTNDPSSLVFRQLDLLSPDKIAANKDISLFARVGYRYRKKSADVDQLNWSAPSNQTANTTIAPSVSDRAPGSKTN